jgi:pimeloyl-ACP methyl ester carboxylesterase
MQATRAQLRGTTSIVQGNKDIVVPPISAFMLAEHLPNAQLIVYSDASHGAQYQHAKIFLEHVKLFMTSETEVHTALVARRAEGLCQLRDKFVNPAVY